jgi:hypothetical protein
MRYSYVNHIIRECSKRDHYNYQHNKHLFERITRENYGEFTSRNITLFI